MKIDNVSMYTKLAKKRKEKKIGEFQKLFQKFRYQRFKWWNFQRKFFGVRNHLKYDFFVRQNTQSLSDIVKYAVFLLYKWATNSLNKDF